MRPTAVGTLPASVRAAIADARREFGAGSAQLRTFRGQRSAALRLLAGREPLTDGQAIIATFTGTIDYRSAIARPGDPKRVTGKFAYVMLSPATGDRLELGVQQSVPPGLKATVQPRRSG